MPIPFILSLIFDGPPKWMPEPWVLLKWSSALGALGLTKWYTTGTKNPSERDMHGRVVLITGGTSGIGAAVASELARRGAQLVLLTQLPPSDPFLVDFIDDMRAQSDNHMIYAEQVDLMDLHSVRKFATKWVDNAPPRRLDTIILCANTMTPPGKKRTVTPEGGVETTWMVNFLANFHLLGILSPALRAQPFDRDVRVIIPTCSAYISSPPLEQAHDKKTWTPAKAYAASKMAMMVFAQAYQKHLDAYKRPDGLPMNTRVVLADPGLVRTPGMRRWLTRGSLFGLFVYSLLYFFVWLFLKSPYMGAQSILYAVMDGSVRRGPGGKFIKECMEVDFARKDVKDEEVAKKLWESSDKLVEDVEKQLAVKRARLRKEQELRAKESKEKEQVEEIESLVDAIKKGKAKEAQKSKGKKKTKGDGKAVR